MNNQEDEKLNSDLSQGGALLKYINGLVGGINNNNTEPFDAPENWGWVDGRPRAAPELTEAEQINADEFRIFTETVDSFILQTEEYKEEYAKMMNLINNPEDRKKEVWTRCADGVLPPPAPPTQKGGGWIEFAAKGSYGLHTGSAKEFNTIYNASPTKIIHRECKNCHADYRDIYYKRKTPLGSLNLYKVLTNDWFGGYNNLQQLARMLSIGGGSNIFRQDFDLYSTYQDALANRNPWTFCNFNDPGVGFPRDCGKSGHRGGQWNSFTRGGQPNWRFSIDSTPANAAANINTGQGNDDYTHQFDDCCRGGAAQRWRHHGHKSKDACEAICNNDTNCNAIEINGTPGRGGGSCFTFSGSGTDLKKGRCGSYRGNKQCYKKSAQSDKYLTCAREGQYGNCLDIMNKNPGAKLRFGNTGGYRGVVWKDITQAQLQNRGGRCDNGMAGDPYPGVYKQCQIQLPSNKLDIKPLEPIVVPVPVITAANKCNIPEGTARLSRFGSGDDWEVKAIPPTLMHRGWFECGKDWFGGENAPGKQCDTMSYEYTPLTQALSEYNIKAEQLVSVGIQIQEQLDVLNARDEQEKFEINQVKLQVEGNIGDLENIRQEIINSVSNIDIVENMENMDESEYTGPIPLNAAYSSKLANINTDSKYKLDSNYLQFIIWLILAVLLVLLSVHTYSSADQSMLVQLVIGAVAIFLLYQLITYFYNKFF